MSTSTNLVLSCRHLTNVVCSCGRNGFKAIPPFLIMMVKVDKMALFTCQGNLSPIIRIRGLLSKKKIIIIIVRNHKMHNYHEHEHENYRIAPV